MSAMRARVGGGGWVGGVLRLQATLAELALDPADAYARSVALVPDAVRRRLYAPALRSALQGYGAADLRVLWKAVESIAPRGVE